MSYLFNKRLKSASEMDKDPDFHLRVGRLIGASEMASVQLSKPENAEFKHIGEQLSFVADWFFVHDKKGGVK